MTTPAVDPARIQADLEALVALESPTSDPVRVTAAIAAVEERLREAPLVSGGAKLRRASRRQVEALMQEGVGTH